MKFAILFGGSSYEHEISIVSTIVLKKVLNLPLAFIFCDEDRTFYHIPSHRLNAQFFSSKSYKKEKKLSLKQGGFYQKELFGEKKLPCDCIINLIHGRDGEDGKIAALLEFFSLPFIGPRLEASVLSFNKELTKIYARYLGIKTLPHTVLKKHEEQNFTPSFPCILKPARLGSSIGISVAKNTEEFDYAKDVAFELDDSIVVEDFKSDIKEYNLAGAMVGEEWIYSIIEEPKKQEFLDFEQKYLSFSHTGKIEEAPLSETLKNKLKASFAKIYNPLFRGALIRCDFFVFEDEVYLNEINPCPGSLAHYLFKDFSNLIEKLAHYAQNEGKIAINYDFLHTIRGQKGKL